MPTASARGALVTDCQYVAISGIWVQCQQATALKNRARRRHGTRAWRLRTRAKKRRQPIRLILRPAVSVNTDHRHRRHMRKWPKMRVLRYTEARCDTKKRVEIHPARGWRGGVDPSNRNRLGGSRLRRYLIRAHTAEQPARSTNTPPAS